MTSEAVLLRLRATEPGRWHAIAAGWRRWATLAGHLAAEVPSLLVRITAAWSGTAAQAAVVRLTDLHRALVAFRLLCWQADQAISEFATALERAHALLPHDPDTAGTVAGQADTIASAQLTTLGQASLRPPGPARPPCPATPASVRQWWTALTKGEQLWLLAEEPGWPAACDGIPAADRDAANRLLLDDRRAAVDQAIRTARGGELDRLRGLRHGLDALADRLADDHGPRAYLFRLDLAGEGRVVLALGDPDRADHVLTYVPGMTSDLASMSGELTRAARVAGRATEIAPAASTSAVLWLDYDAPDSLAEAFRARQAVAGAPALEQFQAGLRATHQRGPAHQTVLGHSYGSLLVGTAAAAGLDADDVVFVGSPGVGVDSAAELRTPAGHVWSSTSRSDVIQYAAVSPLGLVDETSRLLGLPDGRVPGLPESRLWFGENPSDPAFGARLFASRPDAGHLGYWDPGTPSLDALAAITLGKGPIRP